jgi:hypothetical protein
MSSNTTSRAHNSCTNAPQEFGASALKDKEAADCDKFKGSAIAHGNLGEIGLGLASNHHSFAANDRQALPASYSSVDPKKETRYVERHPR